MNGVSHAFFGPSQTREDRAGRVFRRGVPRPLPRRARRRRQLAGAARSAFPCLSRLRSRIPRNLCQEFTVFTVGKNGCRPWPAAAARPFHGTQPTRAAARIRAGAAPARRGYGATAARPATSRHLVSREPIAPHRFRGNGTGPQPAPPLKRPTEPLAHEAGGVPRLRSRGSEDPVLILPCHAGKMPARSHVSGGSPCVPSRFSAFDAATTLSCAYASLRAVSHRA
jgi:hypothetical protein